MKSPDSSMLSPSLLNAAVLEYGHVYEEIFNQETGIKLKGYALDKKEGYPKTIG